MEPTLDDKSYKNDTRLFRDAVTQDGIHTDFHDSVVSQLLQANDICVYGPTDRNKVGKIGNTSWDSFSYALLMAHNVWHHINAVQTANELYEQGTLPLMLAGKTDPKYNFSLVVNDIFSQKTRQASLDRIKYYESCFDQIIGTRGFTGKNLIRTSDVLFDTFFEEENSQPESNDLDSTYLELLEIK
jgi:hypothetical protein